MVQLGHACSLNQPLFVIFGLSPVFLQYSWTFITTFCYFFDEQEVSMTKIIFKPVIVDAAVCDRSCTPGCTKKGLNLIKSEVRG